MRFVRHFVPSVFAGMVMALGTATATFAGLGALGILFGAFCVVAVQAFDLSLFTVRSAELFRHSSGVQRRFVKLCISVVGNLVGALLIGFALGCATEITVLPLAFEESIEGITALFLRAILCGVLLFVAMHGYKRLSGGFSGSLLACFAFSAAELCGLHFALTEVFRLAASGTFSAEGAFGIVLILLGNILGAILGAWLHSLRRDTEDGDKHKA